jgi:hypothetical protein
MDHYCFAKTPVAALYWTSCKRESAGQPSPYSEEVPGLRRGMDIHMPILQPTVDDQLSERAPAIRVLRTEVARRSAGRLTWPAKSLNRGRGKLPRPWL